MNKNGARFVSVLALIFLGSCLAGQSGCEREPSTAQTEMRQVEEGHKKLTERHPPIIVGTSLERINLNKRLAQFDNESYVGNIYLLNDEGKIVAHYQTTGKVTSLNSYLTAMEQVVWLSPPPIPPSKKSSSNVARESFVIEAPDHDASYGQNVDGIFFFTYPDDNYVEWNGKFIFSRKPLKFQSEKLPEAGPERN